MTKKILPVLVIFLTGALVWFLWQRYSVPTSLLLSNTPVKAPERSAPVDGAAAGPFASSAAGVKSARHGQNSAASVMPWDEQLSSILDRIATAATPDEAAGLREELKTALQSLNKDNVSEAIKAFKKAGILKGERYQDLYVLIDAWAAFDTYGAIDFALKQSQSHLGDAVATSMILELNPTDAIGYLTNQPLEVQREAAMQWRAYQDFSSKAGQNPESMHDGERIQFGGLGALVRIWFQNNPGAAQVWLENMSTASRSQATGS